MVAEFKTYFEANEQLPLKVNDLFKLDIAFEEVIALELHGKKYFLG